MTAPIAFITFPSPVSVSANTSTQLLISRYPHHFHHVHNNTKFTLKTIQHTKKHGNSRAFNYLPMKNFIFTYEPAIIAANAKIAVVISCRNHAIPNVVISISFESSKDSKLMLMKYNMTT